MPITLFWYLQIFVLWISRRRRLDAETRNNFLLFIILVVLCVYDGYCNYLHNRVFLKRGLASFAIRYKS